MGGLGREKGQPRKEKERRGVSSDDDDGDAGYASSAKTWTRRLLLVHRGTEALRLGRELGHATDAGGAHLLRTLDEVLHCASQSHSSVPSLHRRGGRGGEGRGERRRTLWM